MMKDQKNEGIVQIDNKIGKQGLLYFIEYEMADFLIQQFKAMSDQFINIDILKVQMMAKPLDNPLSFTKNLIASIFNIQKKHVYILMQTKLFLITIDYYIGNRIRIRMGQTKNIFYDQKSKFRPISIFYEQKNEKCKLQIAQGKLKIRDLLKMLQIFQPKAHSEAFYNGLHFSKDLMYIIQQIIKSNK